MAGVAGFAELPQQRSKGLLDLFWDLSGASPRQRTNAACRLVQHLLQVEAQRLDQSCAVGPNDQPDLPSVPSVEMQKTLRLLKPAAGAAAVPYDLQYTANRLVRKKLLKGWRRGRV